MNLFELMYVKSSTFLRDVFQYLFSGILFTFLLLLGLSVHGSRWSQVLDGAFGSSFPLRLIFGTIFAYAAGHILYITGGMLCYFFGSLGRSWRRRAPNSLEKKKENLKSRLDSIDIGKKALSTLNKLDHHLYYEMRVFKDAPELHARFVERYNVLTHMRKSLSSCFFWTSIIYFLLLPKKAAFISIEVGLLLLSILLLRYVKLTEGHFLDRVYVSYLIAEKEKAEKGK